jgi:hypothetical protein
MGLELPELPRHVKKPGGLWKRVENEAELAAALAEGWVVKLSEAVPPSTSGVVLTDAAYPSASDTFTGSPFPGTLETPRVADAPIPDIIDDPDGAPPAEPDAEPEPKRGRPKKGA